MMSPGLHGGAAAGDGDVRVPRDVPAAEHGGVRVGVVGGHVHGGHGGEVADAAVGDDGRGAADLGAEGQDVADGAGALLAAGLHHEDLALVDGVDGLLLGVEAAAVGLEEVLAVGHVAQGPGQAHDPLLRPGGGAGRRC